VCFGIKDHVSYLSGTGAGTFAQSSVKNKSGAYTSSQLHEYQVASASCPSCGQLAKGSRVGVIGHMYGQAKSVPENGHQCTEVESRIDADQRSLADAKLLGVDDTGYSYTEPFDKTRLNAGIPYQGLDFVS